MKIPISKRLLCCAEWISPGARVADVGCDHGYLSIYLLKENIAAGVVASDLRENPLRTARENAARFQLDAQIRFVLGDGLAGIAPDEVDTIVCAGMGGDNIASILQHAPWLQDARYTLILQPQTSGNDLRRWLGEHEFSIEQERLVQDGGYLYAVMKARFGAGRPLSPGRQYVSEQLLCCGSPLLGEYLVRAQIGVQRAVEGIGRSGNPQLQRRMAYYEAALREIKEMRAVYDNRTDDT